MTLYADSIQIQIDLIEEAMKKAGVWSTEIPDWVTRYREEPIPDIWQWLQYIYLPMRYKGTVHKPHYVAPLLSPYLNTESPLKEILQLVIELDSISPTIPKS
ncbi:MAG: hypothetical protein ABIQ02_02220 [Saprospiraceae bacterium]